MARYRYIVATAMWGLVASVALQAPAAPPPACEMALAFHQKDGNAPGGRTPVWSGAASGQAPPSLLFIEKLNVNTDGTRRSYRVADFWGEHDALNNLCNAMTDGCAGLGPQALRQRRLLTQQAREQGWPRELTASTRLSPQIIPFRAGKPCPEVDGFLVSATALHRPGQGDACDIARYVDALDTSAIVLPKSALKGQPSEFVRRNARVGDLVVTLRPERLEPVFAVVGDTGPSDQLGEGSVALNGRLLGKTRAPANYLELRGKPPFQGQAWTVPPVAVLVFPGTGNPAEPFMTQARIDREAARLFERWGGPERARACIEAYRR